MRWTEFLTVPTGGEVLWRDISPEEQSAKTILPITKNVRPRMILVARHPDGSDVLLVASQSTYDHTFCCTMGYWHPDGSKTEPRTSNWLAETNDEQVVQMRLIAIAYDFEETARAVGADVMRINFHADATDEELLTIMRESGVFDVIERHSKQ